MKKEEISARYNEYIAQLLTEGFAIEMTELRGGYGFFGQQVCFSNGNEFVVMWMEEDYSPEGFWYVHEIHRYIARFEVEDRRRIEYDYGWPRQWKEHLVLDETLYQFDRGEWYTDSREEAIEADMKKRDRASNRIGNRLDQNIELKVTDDMMNIVRRIEGFKTIKRCHIKVTRVPRGYIIENIRSRNQEAVYFK